MRAIPLPSAELLRERLAYDPDTGAVTWLERPASSFKTRRAASVWNARFAGKPAGCLSGSARRKCRIVAVDSVRYLEHRIIWTMVTGEAPADEIDHEDTDATNNRWSNLREATTGENACNRRLRLTSLTGFKGVYFSRDRYRAKVCIEGANRYLGDFDTAEDAHAAYCDAARVAHGEFHRAA